MDSGDAISDQREGQLDVGRRTDQMHATTKIECDDRRFALWLGRGVDQIEPVGPVAHGALNAVNGRLDAFGRQTGGAEETDHARPGHRLDDRLRPDAIGHGAGDIGIGQPVGGAESGVAELAGSERRRVAHKPPRA